MSGGALDYAYSKIELMLEDWPKDLGERFDGVSPEDIGVITARVGMLRADAKRFARHLREFEWWLSYDHSSETYAQMIRDGEA